MTLPIRIAHVMGKMNGGGVESVVLNYYRHIDREMMQFDLLVDSDSTDVSRDEVEGLGGRIINVPPYQKLPEYLCMLEDLFRHEQWPIVHSHINALSVFPLRAAKRVGVPVRIAHSHSTSGKGEPAKNVVKGILRTQANRYPTHRMACSEYAGKWLFGKDAEFTILYNAIDLSKFAFSASVRAEARRELGLVEGDIALGHVGRFMTQKNHPFLIDVFTEVAKREPRAILLLVGNGELRPAVERLANERGFAGRVRFLGQRGDIERLYQAFDAFVLPSLYEGLCLVGVEAQRAGLPCFFSDAITREVDLTGKASFVSLDNPNEWAEQILASIAQRQQRGFSNKELCGFTRYDITRAAKSLESFYLQALES